MRADRPLTCGDPAVLAPSFPSVLWTCAGPLAAGGLLAPATVRSPVRTHPA